MRVHSAITLADSEPEPDVLIVRGGRRDYPTRLPSPPNLSLVVEIAETSLRHDHIVKGRIYARAGIPVYWVVNVIDRQVEVYSEPTGDVPEPACQDRFNLTIGQLVPVVIDGQKAAEVAVADLMP